MSSPGRIEITVAIAAIAYHRPTCDAAGDPR
jgi:hypothetical protein